MPNRFDTRYEIRLAMYSEISEIMQFIDEYWKKGIYWQQTEIFLNTKWW